MNILSPPFHTSTCVHIETKIRQFPVCSPKVKKNTVSGQKKWPVCGPYKKHFLLHCGRCNMQIAARPLQKEARVSNINDTFDFFHVSAIRSAGKNSKKSWYIKEVRRRQNQSWEWKYVTSNREKKSEASEKTLNIKNETFSYKKTSCDIQGRQETESKAAIDILQSS